LNVYTLLHDDVKPVQVPFVILTSLSVNHVTPSLNVAVTAIGFVFVGFRFVVVRTTVGAVVSILKGDTFRELEILLATSLTLSVQVL
jgi:hypothetical protein